MRLEDIASFLQNEFNVEVIRFSINKVLKKAK